MDKAIIYRTHFEAIENLPEEQQLAAFKAIVRFCMDDEEPESGTVEACILGMAKPILDKWKSTVKAGQKGGEKQQESNSEPKDKSIKHKDINNKNTMPSYGEIARDAIRIIDHLNEKAGTRYRSNTKSTYQAISARLSERFTVQDFFTVIDKKCDEWMGTEMEKHLNPDTLFRPPNFEKYLNQNIVKKRKSERPPNRFQNFENRNDAESKALMAKVIAMNGRTACTDTT